MDKLEIESSNRSRKTPYDRSKPKKKLKSTTMNPDDGVLVLNADSNDELLKCNSSSVVPYNNTTLNSKQSKGPIADVARNEMMLLLINPMW